jgi:hypothetical protein
MTDLVEGHGWLVPSICKIRNGLNAMWAVPDEYKAAHALEDAYNHPDKTKKYGEDSRTFALDYDFDKKILPQWVDLLGEVESELGMFGTAQNKDAAFEALFSKALKA